MVGREHAGLRSGPKGKEGVGREGAGIGKGRGERGPGRTGPRERKEGPCGKKGLGLSERSGPRDWV